MDTHLQAVYLPMDVQQRSQSQSQLHQAQYHGQRLVSPFGGQPIIEPGAAYIAYPPHRIAAPSTQNQQPYPNPPSQPLSRAHPREQAQYGTSPVNNSGSSTSSPPAATTTLGFERRTRRRRSFRGAATKLARRKSSASGTKVAPIPEDTSSSTPTSGANAASAPERVSMRSYQYRPFHQADTGSAVPPGGEYSTYQPSAPSGVTPPPQNEYTYTHAHINPGLSSNGQPATPSNPTSASAAGNAPASSEPPARKSRTMTALALGKRAVREVLGGGGNNQSNTPLKVTYFGRGGAGTRRSGQLPTIRADSFGTTKNPAYGLHTPALSTSSAYAPSVVGSSSYAPSVASAPYTSNQSYGGSSPILSHRSLSPNMFGGSRLSLSSYSGTLATSTYDDEAPEGWYDQYGGHDQDPRFLKAAGPDGRGVVYVPAHGDLREEVEEYDPPPIEGSGTPEMKVPISYAGPGGEVYIIDNDAYSGYPPQYEENSMSPPSLKPPYQEYRSPSTTTSSSNESTPMVQPHDGIPQQSPPPKSLPYSSLANTLTPPSVQNGISHLKPPLPNEVQYQPSAGTPYLDGSSNSSVGSASPGGPGNAAPILPAGPLDLSSALQLQTLYATLLGLGPGGIGQLYPQQQQLLQANVAMLNGMNGNVLGHADLSTALAQLSLLTQPMLSPRPDVMPMVSDLSRAEDSTSSQLYSPLPSRGPVHATASGPTTLLMPTQPSHVDYQLQGTAQYLSQTELEIAQTVARKQELEKKLQELEYQRLQREQALALPPSFDNTGGLPTSQRFYTE